MGDNRIHCVLTRYAGRAPNPLRRTASGGEGGGGRGWLHRLDPLERDERKSMTVVALACHDCWGHRCLLLLLIARGHSAACSLGVAVSGIAASEAACLLLAASVATSYLLVSGREKSEREANE